MFDKHPKGLIAAALANLGERFWLLYYDGYPCAFLSKSKFGMNGKKQDLFTQLLFFYLHFGVGRRYYCR